MTDDRREELSASERKRYLDAALEFADACRAAIKRVLAAGVDVRLKPDGSLVTNADLEAERAFRDAVGARYPDAAILGEEFGETNAGAALQWVIDPIDGTTEFAKSIPLYSTIIALRYKGLPVAGVIDQPALSLRCYGGYGLGAFQNGDPLRIDDLTPDWIRGAERIALPSRATFLRHGNAGQVFDALALAHPNFRIFHTGYAHVCALTEAVDAGLEWRVRVWDVAATQLLVEEAGGLYRSLEEHDEPGIGRVYSAVFGKPALVERLVELVSRVSTAEEPA